MGTVVTIGGLDVLVPYGWLLDSPLRFFRYPFRFMVLMGFGMALLIAAALQWLEVVAGRVPGRVLVWGFGLVILATRGAAFSGGEPSDVAAQHHRIYAEVARVAAQQGPGPLLELPVDARLADAVSMPAASRHRLPLVLGHTGYQPPHREAVDRMVEALPDSLDDLVEASRVRWILLQPSSEWNVIRDRDAWWNVRGVEHVLEVDGYDLFRVDRESRGGWYDAIRRGWRPGESSLGTPFGVLPPGAAIAKVRGSNHLEMAAGGSTQVTVRVVNMGNRIWPATSSRRADQPFAVRLAVTWTRLSPRLLERKPTIVHEEACDLPWDVRPGTSVSARCLVRAPEKPGLYALEIRPHQTDGTAFDHPLNTPLNALVLVRPLQSSTDGKAG
jgi:hypothetical protein